MPEQDFDFEEKEPAAGDSPDREENEKTQNPEFSDPFDERTQDDEDDEETQDEDAVPLVDDLYRFDFHRLRPLYGIEKVRRFYEIRRSWFSAIKIGLHLLGVTIFGAYLYYGLGYFLLGRLPEYGIVYFTFLAIAYLIACVPLYRFGSEPCRKAKAFLLYLMTPESKEELLKNERVENRIRIAALTVAGCVIIALFAYKPVDTYLVRRHRYEQAQPTIQAVCLSDTERGPFNL